MEETHQSNGSHSEGGAIERALHAVHHTAPRLLVVGTETAVFDAASPVRARILAYGARFHEMHLIVMCRGRYKKETVGNVTFYPTNAPTRLLYGTYALFIARRLPPIDIVSAQDPHDSGLLAFLIARWKGAAFHVQVHSDIFSDSYRAHSLLNALRAQVARFVLARADGIRVVSDVVKRSIEARLPPKRPISVLPIFVDLARFQHAEPGPLAQKYAAFKNIVLWVGRFAPEKRPELAIEVFAAAADTEACLIMLGKGTGEAVLRAHARRFGLESRVFFEHWQDPAPFYALADVLLVTSDYEGYGLAIIEALASGTPVLARDVGIARVSGAMIAPEESLADALREWFAHGPRTAMLKDYPYKDFTEYVARYSADIAAAQRA